ncbi:MAG: hypothetical protein ACXVCY_16970 [Pseudobdellovibrionaceae bacterium]
MKKFALLLIFSIAVTSAKDSHAISSAPVPGWPGWSTTVGPFSTDTGSGKKIYLFGYYLLSQIDKMTLDAAVEDIPVYHANKIIPPSLAEVVKTMKEVCSADAVSCSTDDMVKMLEEITTEQ